MISEVCVILHNMIVYLGKTGLLDGEVDDCGQLLGGDIVSEFAGESSVDDASSLGMLLEGADRATSRHQHSELRKALIDHLTGLEE